MHIVWKYVDYAASAIYWLTANARRFGFFMPTRTGPPARDNPHGIAYEPWHGCHYPLA
jgi:zinc D-Ala-D-Ala carboxypeptidase